MIKYKKELHYTLERYPENCKECPCFSTSTYIEDYYVDVKGHCELGYMTGDMRGFEGRCLFNKCNIKNDSRVNLMNK